MADTKLTALTETTAPATSDDVYVVTTPGGTPASKRCTIGNLRTAMDATTYAAIKASRLINEIKGWPPCVKTGDLDALNLWFDKVGTPTTAPTLQDTSAAGLTDTYETCLKIVADAASEGMSQTWTYADEPRVKAGSVLSTLWAVWCVSGVGVTVSLVNSDATKTDAAKVTAAAWTIVEVPNHTLAGTSCNVQLVTDGAGTFYCVPLGANIGARGFPLPPRQQRYIEGAGDGLVGNGDSGATFTDCDATSVTSPLATRIALVCSFTVNAAGKDLSVRRNGDTLAYGYASSIGYVVAAGTYYHSNGEVQLDDGQIFEWQGSDVGANTENIYIYLRGWWEWA